MKPPLAPLNPSDYGITLHRGYEHRKSTAVYVPIALARLEADPEVVLVVYVSPNEAVWVRPVDEFLERFRVLGDIV